MSEDIKQAVESYIEARARVIWWRNKHGWYDGQGSPRRNPEVANCNSKGNALMRVLEMVAERRAEQDGGR